MSKEGSRKFAKRLSGSLVENACFETGRFGASRAFAALFSAVHCFNTRRVRDGA